MIFNKLPEVDSCCCCISLKLGVILIGLYFIAISVLQHSLSIDFSEEECYKSTYNEHCPFRDIMPYFMYFVYFEAFMSFLPSTLLIMAVFIDNRTLITMFLYFITISMLINIVLGVSILLINVTEPECKTSGFLISVICIFAHIAAFFCFIYSIIVVKSYRSAMIAYQRQAITDSHGNKIIMNDDDNISKYGRLMVTRKYEQVTKTKDNKSNGDLNKMNTGANNTGEINENRTSKYVYKTNKNVYSIHINSNKTIEEEDENNSCIRDNETGIDLNKTADIIEKESIKTNNHVNVTSTEINKSNTEVDKKNTGENDNESKTIAHLINTVFEEGNSSKHHNKIKADVDINSVEEIKTNKSTNNNNVHIKRSSAELIAISEYMNNQYISDTNEIYRNVSNTMDITSAEIIPNCIDGSKTTSIVNKSNSEK